MIVDKYIDVSVNARNISISKRLVNPELKNGDIINIHQTLALEVAKSCNLELSCDFCETIYYVRASKLLSGIKNITTKCGKCRSKDSAELMRITVRRPEHRSKRSQITKDFYKTPRGKQVAIEHGKNHKEYISSNSDFKKILYSNLNDHAPLSGKDHYRYKPELERKAFDAYRNRVRSLSEQTYKIYQGLINPNKYKRTKSGVEGGYQLDHIISIYEGYNRNLPEYVIAHVNNLQMLSWEDNRNKSFK